MIECCDSGNRFIKWDDDLGSFFLSVREPNGGGVTHSYQVEVCPFCSRPLFAPEFKILNKGSGRWVVDPSPWLLRQLYLLQHTNVLFDEGKEEARVRVEHIDAYIRSNLDKLNPLILVPSKEEYEQYYEKEPTYVFTSTKSTKIIGRGTVKVVNLKDWTLDKVRALCGKKAIIDGEDYVITGTEYGTDGLSNYKIIGPVSLKVKLDPDKEQKT